MEEINKDAVIHHQSQKIRDLENFIENTRPAEETLFEKSQRIETQALKIVELDDLIEKQFSSQESLLKIIGGMKKEIKSLDFARKATQQIGELKLRGVWHIAVHVIINKLREMYGKIRPNR